MYSTNDVVKEANVSASTFQQWAARGLVPANTVTHGGRSYRKYTESDAAVIRLMGVLNRAGIGPTEARLIADRIVSTGNGRVELCPGVTLMVDTSGDG